jgi:hypothetical protein
MAAAAVYPNVVTKKKKTEQIYFFKREKTRN